MKHMNTYISLLCILALLACLGGCAVQEAPPLITTGESMAAMDNTTIDTTPIADTTTTDAAISLSAVVASGLSDSSGGDAKAEIAGYKVVQVEDAFAPRQATVTFNGKTYTGEYSRSEGKNLTYKLRHIYNCQDGSRFDIDAETGQLVTFVLGKEYDVLRLSEAECKALANEIASQLVDISQYTLTEQAIEADNYLYKYIKYVGDFETSDRFNIIIDPNKGLTDFYSTDIGAFSEELLSSTTAEQEQLAVMLASSAAEETVNQKIAALCEGSQYSYRVDNKILVRMQDGAVGMIYNTAVQKDGSSMGRIHILVYEDS